MLKLSILLTQTIISSPSSLRVVTDGMSYAAELIECVSQLALVRDTMERHRRVPFLGSKLVDVMSRVWWRFQER